MPQGGLNAPRKAVAGGSRSELIHGDEIAATATTATATATRGKTNMKRAKRVSAGADRVVDCSSTEEDLSASHLELAGPKSKKRFVGVRQRPSGRWVAEIKDTTQKIRLWLGTFDSAEEGAKAYDSAARALRGANTRTNFVPAVASSCETTTSVPTKAARLIRLRQTAAAASSKPCAVKCTVQLGLNQPDVGTNNADHVHSQEVPENNIQPLSLTSETRSNAINHTLAEDHCNAVDEPPKQETNFSCRADAEAASSADDNEVMDTGNDDDAVYTNNNNNDDNNNNRADDAESPLRQEDHQLDHRNNNINNSVLDVIPWPDYELMDGLDLSCETTSTAGVYPAFDFSEEAMDRDSEHYLSDGSSEFLLTLQQPPPCTNQSFFQAELSTERSPVSVLKDDSTVDTDECQGQAEQALWSSVDLAPLCMVA